jgi:hypothetical protein
MRSASRTDFARSLVVWSGLLALTAALSVPTEAARRPSQRYWEVSWQGGAAPTHLREGPSPLERSLLTLPTGTPLKDLGCVDGDGGERWCRVQVLNGNSERGWVRREQLRPSKYRGGRLPQSAGAAAAIETLRYDAIGTVRCSAPTDAVDASCTFRLVRDDDGATLLLANPARISKAPLRVIRFEAGEFSTRDGSLVWSEAADDGWLVAVDGNEYYLLERETVAGR